MYSILKIKVEVAYVRIKSKESCEERWFPLLLGTVAMSAYFFRFKVFFSAECTIGMVWGAACR